MNWKIFSDDQDFPFRGEMPRTSEMRFASKKIFFSLLRGRQNRTKSFSSHLLIPARVDDDDVSKGD